MTEFRSFDNSTCKRVLDPLKPSDLTLGQVVIKRVAVVELVDQSQLVFIPEAGSNIEHVLFRIGYRL